MFTYYLYVSVCICVYGSGYANKYICRLLIYVGSDWVWSSEIDSKKNSHQLWHSSVGKQNDKQ